MASSLVGVMTRHWGAWTISPAWLSAWDSISLWRMGRRKAAVLPDPVWAQDMRSRPDMTMGRQRFCTGVGTLYPDLVMFS